MAWRSIVLTSWLLQCIQATFPPVSNPPPIPNQAVRTVDISGQRFYVQDDLQINPPQTVVKAEGYYPPPPLSKLDDQRWFISENQSGETGDFPSSTEALDRYYSNGQPAVGPVATPVPDDTYVAQPSGTSKVIPDRPVNVGSSDIWVLAKGPDDQYLPQRWMQVQMPQGRIVQVVSSDAGPQIISETVKSQPSPLQPVKNLGQPIAANNVVQQVWVRSPQQVQPQNIYQTTATVIGDVPPPKQVSDAPPFKQYVQTQIVQDPQNLPPLPPPINVVNQKSSSFVLPPPLPPPYKGGDISPTQQTVVVNQPATYKGVDVTLQNQALVPSQPTNYKGVDINSPNQAGIVVQPASYKGVDITPTNQAVLINQPVSYKGADIPSTNQAILVNQPANYKGVDVTSPNQAILVGQPANYKGVDINTPNQAVLVNQPASYKSVDITSPKQVAVVSQPQYNVPVGKSNGFTQVKHIWIPTSSQTGKFITVPIGTAIGSGKSVPAKGLAVDAAPPISVSGTWVLKQDGPLPRFEPQRLVSSQVLQKGNPLGPGTVLQVNSQKNPPLVGKSVDTTVPVDVWAARKDFPNPIFVAKGPAPSTPFSIPTVKSGSVVVGNNVPVSNFGPQKTYISNDKGLPPQPLPAPVASPVLQVTKGKPCIIGPQKSLVSPRDIPYPAYRTVNTVNTQPLPRILRLNRYPYGSYYVLNPRVGPSLYAYPRPQAPAAIQQTRNGLVRIISTKQLGIPPKQVYVSVPRKQVSLPVPQSKIASPVQQYPFAFPPVQAVNRIRYAYPWGSYLRSLPAAGKNVFIFPSNKQSKPDTLQSSSSESSSSESSSSESKSAELKPKAKEQKKSLEAESVGSPESEEVISERETEDEETAASEPKSESKEASVPESSEAKSETNESIETSESMANPVS